MHANMLFINSLNPHPHPKFGHHQLQYKSQNIQMQADYRLKEITVAILTG